MKQRVITAVVALILFIPIILYGSWAIECTAILLGLIGLYELFRMKKMSFFSLEGLFASLALFFILAPSQMFGFTLFSEAHRFLFFYVCLMLLLLMTVFSKNTFQFDDAGVAILGALYIGFGFHYFIEARQAGLAILLFCLFIVWATDIGAYMIGRKVGKHKLAPAISPNKTIEGSIGGIICALIVAVIFKSTGHINGEWSLVLVGTILFSVGGQLGDLIESAYKRYYGVKDSGNILPGHGGILDRFDSLLFVFPLVHLVGLI